MKKETMWATGLYEANGHGPGLWAIAILVAMQIIKAVSATLKEA